MSAENAALAERPIGRQAIAGVRPQPALEAEIDLLRLVVAAREAEVEALQDRLDQAERSAIEARALARGLEAREAERFRELAALAKLLLAGAATGGLPVDRAGSPALWPSMSPDELRAALAARDARIVAMLGSTSWRLAAPLRLASGWARAAAGRPAGRVEPPSTAVHGGWTPAELREAIAQRDAQIAELESSTSWRLTRPLRAAVDRLRSH